MIANTVHNLLSQAALMLADVRLVEEMGQILTPADREKLRRAHMEVVEVRSKVGVYPFTDVPATG